MADQTFNLPNPDGSSWDITAHLNPSPAPPPPEAPTITLTINPTSAQAGSPATLSWQSTNATDVKISGVDVALSGSEVVTPSATTTYSAVATGAGGTANASVTVTVTQPAPPPPPPPNPVLSPLMQHAAYFPSGYNLWDAVVGRNTKTVHFIRFKPSKSGTVAAIKWYNSAGSHSVWDACTTDYGAIEPCANHGGAPQYEHVQDPSYPKVFPNGWWPYAAVASTTAGYSGAYSGGTGGIRFTLLDANQNVLGTATALNSNEVFGFCSTYPVINFDKQVTLVANTYYWIKVDDPDPNPTANWASFDNYTPYNLFTVPQANAQNLATATINGKAGVADAIVQSSFNGTTETNYQPIFLLGLTDGTCVGQGFAP